MCSRHGPLDLQNPAVSNVHPQMFNALCFRWTGHLPVAIFYVPSASVWLLQNSVAFIGFGNYDVTITTNWAIVSWEAAIRRRGRFLRAHVSHPLGRSRRQASRRHQQRSRARFKDGLGVGPTLPCHRLNADQHFGSVESQIQLLLPAVPFWTASIP